MEEVKDEELMLLRQQLSDSALENSSLALRLKSQNEQSKREGHVIKTLTDKKNNYYFCSIISAKFNYNS